MEKDWDQQVPGPEYWQTIKASCKPGALMMVFGGTRTYHRLTCAVEDAGWEIRDCLMWLHGQGMPKAGDIGKMVDKARGDKCLAKQFTGWANALKPAWEPIVLAMKAMDGTTAHNAETYDVAGLNINGGRIKTDELFKVPQSDPSKREGVVGTNLGITRSSKKVFQAAQRESIAKTQELGRYPANLILDEEIAHLLDEQTGTLTSGTNCVRSKVGNFGEHGGLGRPGDVQVTYGDSGGASRFFYTAKASKSEKGKGNDHPTVKPLALMKYLLTLLSTPTGGLILDPFAGSGTTLLAAKQLGRRCIGVELDEHNCEIIAGRLQ
jgi:site-specific DNA-methyltransferase (adenine-specific)